MKLTLALPVAVAIVLAARFLAAPLRGVADYDNADFIRFVAAEKYQLHDREEPPAVLLLGSSRTQYGLDKATLATELGVEAAQISNLSVPEGNPWSSATMLRRNQDRIRGVRAICVDVAPVQFNGARVPLRNRFAHLASLDERLRIDGRPGFRAELTADWATGHLGIRRSLRSYGLGAANARRGTIWGADDAEQLDPVWVNEPDHDRIKREMFAENADWQPGQFAAISFSAYSDSQFLKDALMEIEALAAAAGAHLIIHQPPFHPEFIDTIQQHPEWSRHYAAYLEFLESRASDQVTVLLWERPQGIGIPIEDILDYGHFGRAAAEAYSKRIAAAIKENAPQE